MVFWNGVVGEDVRQTEGLGVESQGAGQIGGHEGEVVDAVAAEGGAGVAGRREVE